ncbi:hypothetical protein FRC0485_02327 [Corynebacterium diphtheriae]|nr:hypothetical protein AY482_10315 [Corynebacterium diphtheriae bv. gravis]CAB0525987.1 hypothetical protein CIP103987_02042 [Corynebacterium diphtheriae]CAB0531657.1 hypothetical protein CIP107515_00047 [Corynebacterium diphtheriae]CAB0571020.1 hypothetical protein CIP107526_02096 [Corynebacterium diphtheriae]CAB0574681.1 hypothetical protein CIP107524_02340 [Corynebacterium diphtheriae]
MDGLDLTVWPCHPHGSWQRALLHQSLGLPVDDADAAALAKWDRHPAVQTKSGDLPSKRDLLRQLDAERLAVIEAACAAIEPGEVVGCWELARRIANQPGMPNKEARRDILKAISPSVKHGLLHKRYIDNLSGRLGHFFAHRPSDFDRFITESKANRRAIGASMRGNLQLGRPRKKES